MRSLVLRWLLTFKQTMLTVARNEQRLEQAATLAAMDGLEDQLDFYLRRGLASGLTRAQSTEALTHLGF